MNKKAIVEGLLFIVGDEGLGIKELMNILETSEDEVRLILKSLQKDYESEDRGIRISFLADSFKLTTKKEHISYYQKLVTSDSSSTLSQAALETLAIIAYNEPITRVQIDEIRGIASSFLLRKLMAKDLIKVSGKSDLPGRPNLYKTTKEFLDYFGLATLDDLPKIENQVNDNDEDLFKSKYVETTEA